MKNVDKTTSATIREIEERGAEYWVVRVGKRG